MVGVPKKRGEAVEAEMRKVLTKEVVIKDVLKDK